MEERPALLEKSFEECKRKVQVDEKRLQPIKGDLEECYKELKTKEIELNQVINNILC
jgi:hypothetical protein